MKKTVFTAAGLCLCIWAQAQAIRSISKLDIRVELQKDGSAWVTQSWEAEAGPTGTEFYLPVGNLGPMTVSRLQLSENGRAYESLGEAWDVDRSRSWKSGKCGIVPKHDGVELCWGLGEAGPHLWTARFFITGLVQAYDDADAFLFQFVNRGMNPAPEHARVRIVPSFDCPAWNYDNTRVWAFGFYGDINVQDGAVVAETSESMSYDSSLIALVKFEKGIFQPSVERGGPFQQLLDRALDGSSYEEEEDGEAWFLLFFALVFLGGLGVVFWALLSTALGYKWRKSFFGKTKIGGWFRDVPLEGNLFAAYYTLTKGRRFGIANGSDTLIGAFFLRWIMNGQVTVQADPNNTRRVNLSFSEDIPGDDVEAALYRMAYAAAGDNRLLEKGEFEKWSAKNYGKMTAWPERAMARGKSWFHDKAYLLKDAGCTPEGKLEACHVVEFRNYLKDFTLSEQREAVEVHLWKDYLVYAQLFGIADRVAGQFKKLYPAQFDELARSTGVDPATLYYTLRWTGNMSTRAFMNAANKAGSINGTGGHASFGGGGGFSGGGFGGGGR